MIDIIVSQCINIPAVAPISIERFIANNQHVKQSACVVEGNIAIIAALTKPIYTQSERAKLIKQLAQEVAEQFELKRVIVTFDSDIFCIIELKTATVGELQDMLSKRNGSYEYIADN